MIQDKGSNYQFYNHTEKAIPPKSAFELTSLKACTVKEAGLIIPIKWYETLPGDIWELDYEALIRVMPQTVPLYSRQRLFVHAYYCSMGQLWNDWEVYYTKGYTGNEKLKKPTIGENNFDTDLWNNGEGTVKAESLADYLELPQGAKYSDLAESNVIATPFMMYERIYRDYYMNKNFYTEDRQWLPNDDGELRLNTAGQIISTIGQEDKHITFGQLHYRDWTQDYFTSALPWPQRGTSETVNLSGSIVSGDLNIEDDNAIEWVMKKGDDVYRFDRVGYMLRADSGAGERTPASSTGTGEISDTQARLQGSGAITITNLIQTTSIDANTIRNLLLNQQELETLARTDGSYAQFGLAFFGEVSKSTRDYKPTYIGGTYQNIVFGEVLQNSESTENSPLGTFAGQGGVHTSSNLGKIKCDDYGYIMICLSIMPDTYYSQGLARKWTRCTQEDEYLPDRAKLGMQAIENRELYFSGNAETDMDVWAYQNRFDELRYEENKIAGKIADPDSLSFFPYTQSRYFDSLPGYSQEFAKTDDIRKDYLASQVESAYIIQNSIKARVVRPLPYKAVPAELI